MCTCWCTVLCVHACLGFLLQSWLQLCVAAAPMVLTYVLATSHFDTDPAKLFGGPLQYAG
jgi:hypothetical protein